MENLQQETDVVEGVQNRAISALIDLGENLSSLPIGQFALRQVDKALWVIEKSALWSLPQIPVETSDTENDTGKSSRTPKELVRPLPWLLFLPTLVVLRVLRVSLNLAALAMSREPLEPITIVRYIQTRRRRIRSMKFLGMRNMRVRRQIISQRKGVITRALGTIYAALCDTLCFRPVQETIPGEALMLKSMRKSTGKACCEGHNDIAETKRKHNDVDQSGDESSEDDEEADVRLIDLVDRLAAVEDDLSDDPDYEEGDEMLSDSTSEDDLIAEEREEGSHGSVAEPIAEENESEVADLIASEKLDLSKEKDKKLNEKVDLTDRAVDASEKSQAYTDKTPDVEDESKHIVKKREDQLVGSNGHERPSTENKSNSKAPESSEGLAPPLLLPKKLSDNITATKTKVAPKIERLLFLLAQNGSAEVYTQDFKPIKLANKHKVYPPKISSEIISSCDVPSTKDSKEYNGIVVEEYYSPISSNDCSPEPQDSFLQARDSMNEILDADGTLAKDRQSKHNESAENEHQSQDYDESLNVSNSSANDSDPGASSEQQGSSPMNGVKSDHLKNRISGTKHIAKKTKPRKK